MRSCSGVRGRTGFGLCLHARGGQDCEAARETGRKRNAAPDVGARTRRRRETERTTAQDLSAPSTLRTPWRTTEPIEVIEKPVMSSLMPEQRSDRPHAGDRELPPQHDAEQQCHDTLATIQPQPASGRALNPEKNSTIPDTMRVDRGSTVIDIRAATGWPAM